LLSLDEVQLGFEDGRHPNQMNWLDAVFAAFMAFIEEQEGLLQDGSFIERCASYLRRFPKLSSVFIANDPPSCTNLDYPVSEYADRESLLQRQHPDLPLHPNRPEWDAQKILDRHFATVIQILVIANISKKELVSTISDPSFAFSRTAFLRSVSLISRSCSVLISCALGQVLVSIFIRSSRKQPV
jgi:hypothetical protein